MIAFLQFIAAVTILVLGVWFSKFLDRKWRGRFPDEKPFAWGYFQALCFFPSGLLWFFVPFQYPQPAWVLWSYAILYGVFGSYAGYMLIAKKKRWAWMFVVLAQFNLVVWIIDYYYGSNRWKEFR